MAFPPIFQAIARVAVVAAPILGRALVDAYRQGMINAAANGARHKAVANKSMSNDEAAKILDVGKDAKLEAVMERYKYLFEHNDPEKGGSAYLQQKIEAARGVLCQTAGRGGGAAAPPGGDSEKAPEAPK
mmetsp:Transcript_60889/g.144997  ORF Transcript_60889/g.144997 Transcript_60889/m.144997 type:complete len:130 (-) Transcript_60889:51-440(-)